MRYLSEVRFLAILCAAVFIVVIGAHAQEKSYWLTYGSTTIGSCEGSQDGEPLKSANADGQWILITAVIICKDLGPAYLFEIDHMIVEINPDRRAFIDRENLNFDWVGLAIYRPEGSGERINWLYDEALPIRGSLTKTSVDRIAFGRLRFPSVPKGDLNRASNFQLYMTAEGALFAFRLM